MGVDVWIENFDMTNDDRNPPESLKQSYFIRASNPPRFNAAAISSALIIFAL